MTDIVGGLSEVATGAAIARATEPAHGESGGHTHEGACLNCGAALVGPHCHECGQRAHVHRTISAFFHDLLHGVLHFEGKTWRTLPMLAWKPGQLTRDYIDGKRARYVSPIALFLFVVFLSFALFNLLGGLGENEGVGAQGQSLAQVKSAYESGRAELAELRQDRADAANDAAKVAKIDAEIADLRKRQDSLAGILGSIGSDFEKGFEKNPLPKGNKLEKALEQVQANPQLAIYKMQTNAYKFSWMLIPLSVPFVWLLFPFSRRFRGYDHTVFTTYSITFMIALVAVASLFGYFGMVPLGLLLLLYAPYHMYRQLRGTYGVGRFGAIWRVLALSTFAWVAIGLFVAVLGWLAAGH
jgi:hypothetical protein